VGATGATGATGPTQKIEVVHCYITTTTVVVRGKRVPREHKKCVVETVTSGVVAHFGDAGAKASLSRAGHVVARGRLHSSPGRTEFILSGARALSRGVYTLTITHGASSHATTTRELITVP
jgi:hypothetical protein